MKLFRNFRKTAVKDIMCEQVLNTVRQLEAQEEGLPVLAPGDKEREAEEGVERRGGIVYSR